MTINSVAVQPRPIESNPTFYSLSAGENKFVTIDAAYIVRVTADGSSPTLSLLVGKSTDVQNVGTEDFFVASQGNTTKTLSPGFRIQAAWSTATGQHELQEDQAGNITVDSAMSDTSSNAVENQVIKAYVDAIGQSVATFNYPGHSLSSQDIGKPINGNGQVFNDKDHYNYPDGILQAIVDANNVLLWQEGKVAVIPYVLFEGGSSFDFLALGRFVYWDSLAGLFKSDRVPAADEFSPAVVSITRKTIADDAFECIVVNKY